MNIPYADVLLTTLVHPPVYHFYGLCHRNRTNSDTKNVNSTELRLIAMVRSSLRELCASVWKEPGIFTAEARRTPRNRW